MLGGPGDRIPENAVLNMARRDIAPGWRDVGGPALSVDRAGSVAQATPRYIAIRRDPCRSAIRGRSARAPRQPGCRPLALYAAAALGSARKSISAFAAIGCWDTYGAPAT